MPDIEGLQGKELWDKLATVNEDGDLEDAKGSVIDYVKQAVIDDLLVALNDKASLSGGEDADFVAMPQVGGSPIIERDSNDDGEWVRFAGNIQIVFLVQNESRSSDGVLETEIDFPVFFTGTAIAPYNNTNDPVLVLATIRTTVPETATNVVSNDITLTGCQIRVDRSTPTNTVFHVMGIGTYQ